MSTLADSFLDDLNDLDDSDEEEVEQASKQRPPVPTFNPGKDLDDLADEDDDDDDDGDGGAGMDNDGEGGGPSSSSMHTDDKLLNMIASKTASAIGQFRQSAKYVDQMSNVKRSLESEVTISEGNLEDDPEYHVILACNKLVHEIDDEVAATYRYVTETYAKKFPELESLVANKIDYIKTVARIGNETDLTLVELNDLLSSANVMVVSVTGSTTSGKPLSDADLNAVMKACEEIIELDIDKGIVLKYVESRMSRFAPNLCILTGSRIAAQLVGLAGGIVALSKIPSCNIQVMGQEKRHLAGFSQAAALPNTGLLYYCELVQECPPALRRKALKVIAGKVALLARVDSYRNMSQRGGAEGQSMRKQIEDKLEKWMEPQKAQTKKALPLPEEKKKSRRGGKRVRRMKERYAVTELQAQQNKLSFTVDAGEYGDSAMGFDVGMVGRKDTGKLRGAVKKESQLAKRAKKAISASSGQTNGLSSSLVFTPVQGIELVNPNAAADRVKAANAKWFNNNSGFMSAAPPK
jgi:U4/U6 small nuclear ribonucleoprotein PRP31